MEKQVFDGNVLWSANKKKQTITIRETFCYVFHGAVSCSFHASLGIFTPYCFTQKIVENWFH